MSQEVFITIRFFGLLAAALIAIVVFLAIALVALPQDATTITILDIELGVTAVDASVAILVGATIMLIELAGYQVESLNNSVYHLQAIRQKEMRRIHIVLDSIRPDFPRLLESSPPLLSICTREVWLIRKGAREFQTGNVP